MKFISKITNMLLFPFELLGQILVSSLRFLWSFSNQFLLSPWGLLVPVTFLVLLFLVMQLAKTPKELSAVYTQDLEHCGDEKIPVLVDALVHLEEAGLPGLIVGLNSDREAVFLACHEALQNEMKRWEESDDILRRFKRYRLLSEAILEQAIHFRPTARLVAARLTQQILRRLAVKLPPEIRQAKELNARISAESSKSNKNCEQILLVMETARKRLLDPNAAGNETTSDSLALQHRRQADSVLMASNGKPFKEAFANDFADDQLVDALALPRAERLLAYHQSPLYDQQGRVPYRRPGMNGLESPNPEASAASMIASMAPTNTTIHTTIGPEWAAQSGKTASQYGNRSPEQTLTNGSGPLDISSGYLARMQGNSSGEKNSYNKRSDSNGGRILSNDSPQQDIFLTEELKNIAPDRIPYLTSSRLMRLLQHPDPKRVSEARKTLIARDGYRDVHLKLAYRLYHSSPAVREGIIDILPNTTGIRPNVWLTELLNDPNPNVRYRAASFLATNNDPAMKRLLIEKGKHDSDQRIVDMVEQLQETQRRQKTKRP